MVDSIGELVKNLSLQDNDRISWWEWNSLLVRLISGRRGESAAIVDPTDSIIVQMKAASESMLYFKKETADDLSAPNFMSRKIVESDSNTTLLSDLQSTVQTLQDSNNILVRRYENALLNSQSTLLTPDLTYNKPSEELEFWERMLRDAESQSVANFDAFLMAKKKLDEISVQGSSGDKDSSMRDSAVASKDRQLLLEQEIATNKKKLADFKALKKKRKLSTAKIGKFLLKYFFPYYKRRTKERRLIRWWTVLSDGIIAMKHAKRRQQRITACIDIQSVARGGRCRQNIKLKKRNAVAIQRVFRGKNARDCCAKIRKANAEEKARKLKELLERSAQKIKDVLLGNRYRRNRSRLLERRRQEELTRLEQLNAANVIQRGSYKKLRRMSLKRKIEENKQRKFEAFLQEERIRERAETLAFSQEEITMLTFLDDEAAFKRKCTEIIEEQQRNASATVIQTAAKNK